MTNKIPTDEAETGFAVVPEDTTIEGLREPVITAIARVPDKQRRVRMPEGMSTLVARGIRAELLSSSSVNDTAVTDFSGLQSVVARTARSVHRVDRRLANGETLDPKILDAINGQRELLSAIGFLVKNALMADRARRLTEGELETVSTELLMTKGALDEQKRRATLSEMVIQSLKASTARLHAAASEWETCALTDGLTGVANRRALDEKGSELCRDFEKMGEPVSSLFIDVNCFKQLNEQFGHDVADQVLREFAGLVSQQLRDSDSSFYRYGGDEFMILVPGTNGQDACIPAERIRAAVDKHTFNVTNHTTGKPLHLKITISIGVAEANYDNPNPYEEMVARGGSAKEACASHGKNIVILCNGGFHPINIDGRNPADSTAQSWKHTLTFNREAVAGGLARARASAGPVPSDTPFGRRKLRGDK